MRYATGYLRYDGSSSGDITFDSPITPTTVKLGKCKMLSGAGSSQFQNADLILLQTSSSSFTLRCQTDGGTYYNDFSIGITISSTSASFRGFGSVAELQIIDTSDNIDTANEVPDWCGILLARIFSSDLSVSVSNSRTIIYTGGIAAILTIHDYEYDYEESVEVPSINVPYNGRWVPSIALNVFPDYNITWSEILITNSNYRFTVEPVYDENGVATKIKFIFKEIYSRRGFNANRYRMGSVVQNGGVSFYVYIGINEYIVNNYHSGEPYIYFKDNYWTGVSAPASNNICIPSAQMNINIELNKNDGKIYSSVNYFDKDVTNYNYVNIWWLCDVSTPSWTHIKSTPNGVFSIENSGNYGVEATYSGNLIIFNRSNTISVNTSLDTTFIYLQKEDLHSLNIEDVKYADEYEIELNGVIIETVRSLKI